MLAGAIVATDSFEEVCEALAKRFASKPTEPPLPELTFETIESTLKDIPRPWAGVVISRAIQRGFAVASTLDIKGQVEDLVSRYLREVAEFAELTFIRTRGSPPQPPAQGQLQSRSKLLMDLIKAVQMLGSMIVDGAEIASSLSEELRRFDTQISKKNAIFREVIKGWLSAIGDDISLARTLPNSPPLAQVPSFICNFLPLKGDTLPSRPARWILVAGLGKQLGPDLDVVCRWLGHVLAMAGFGLVSGGWPGVDEVVTRSFVDRLRSGNADPKNCLRQIIEPGRQPVISEGEIVYTESQQAAFSQSIEEVHAVVLVNGAGGTRRLGELALKMGIPVLPLRVTGGDAAQLFVLLSAKRVSWPSKFLSPRWEILEGDAVSAVAGVPGELRRIFDHTATEDDPQPPKVVFDDLLGIDPEDQNKGRFGGKSEAYGRALSVEVDLDSSTPAAFYFDIVVRSVDGTRLAGPVEFFLHESYKRTKITVKKISASEARLSDVSAYETFTIGAQVKDAANVWRRLELDLATVKDAERWLPKSAPAKPRTAVAFIFQNRFENLNFSEKLRPRQEIVWKVSRYRSMIRSGSLILFWQAQGEGSEFVKGFWGWGVALTDSQRKRGEWSVKVRCIEKWSRSGSSAPIEAKEIFRLPAWKAHALKTMPQGTNFVLDAQQLEGIVALAEKYAGGSRLPAAAKAVVLGAKINQELFVGGDIYWNWPETATADSDPLDNWLKLGKEIRVTDRIAFNDPENESYGTYVTTRGNHVLDFPPRIRICPNPVTNQAFQKFVLDGGYEQKTYWTGKGEASLRSFQTNDHRSLGPSSWASQLDFGKQEPLAPVSGICWHEARAFVRWLNLRHPQGGWTWAIPTEDAWELAARGPNGLIYPWGNTFEVGLCNSAEAGIGRPSEINKFPRGESYYGGHDFAGNVWEFVRDEPESVKSQFCVLRGGSYVNTKDVVKSYLRLWGISKSLRAPDFGFRCGLVPVTPEGQPVAPPVFPKTPSRLK
jgi:formylglycine-generating enzyme required for sulfatase activity